ncbi:MAG: hypothetical protein ABJE95_39420 [Byssovorax sp.]
MNERARDSTSWSLLLALALLLAAPQARAEDYDQATKDAARRYAEEGIAFHERGKEIEAVESFTRAFRVLGAPTVGIRLARSLSLVGRLREARQVYQVVIATRLKKDDPAVFGQAVTDARAELAALEPRIPTLELTLAPGVTSPTLDGAPVSADTLGKPTPIDPGEHHIGGVGAVPEVKTVQEREQIKLTLLAPGAAPPAPPSPQPPANPASDWRRIAGISGLGLAGASVIGAVVGSALAGSVKNDPAFDAYRRQSPTATNVCTLPGTASQPNIESLCSKATTGERLQVILYPAAAVLGGVGAYLLFTSGRPAPAPPARAQITPYGGPNAAGLEVTGTF